MEQCKKHCSNVYSDGDSIGSNDPDLIHIGLGNIANGEFHTIFRNFDEDLKEMVPGIQILSVKDMFVYGSLAIDEIKLLNFIPEVNEINANH